MKEDGSFRFFHFRLGGGKLTLGGKTFSWTADQVDPQTPADDAPVLLYTPYFSNQEQDAPSEGFRLPVGDGRVNFVIIQDRIVCVRCGNVLLPSIGVVFSLSQKEGNELLNRLSLVSSPDGYSDARSLSYELTLDPPDSFSPEEWSTVKWAYGGGLSLIEKGESLFSSSGSASPSPLLAKEGWFSPLSRQTQEKPIQKLEKHPRTAIGTAANGDLFLLVFSGRSLLSEGADYSEMCRIARALIPDVDSMMNVDGGASSVLGLAVDGSFMELNQTAVSTDNVAGMARPIVTALCLEL
jgi:hypothetical protein